MRRADFLRAAGLALPAAALSVGVTGDRNIRDMTLAEVFDRIGGTLSLDGEGWGRNTTRTFVLAHLDTAEVKTCDAECRNCGRSTFRYRWLRPEGWPYQYDEFPSPWFCICGYRVGAPAP